MKLSRGNEAKIEGFMVLTTVLLILAALLSCGRDRPPARLLGVVNPPITSEPSWPQRWSSAEFDEYNRVTGHRPIGVTTYTFSLWPTVSSFVLGQFKIQSPPVAPPFSPPTWQPQRFDVRAAYAGNGMSRIPAIGDTIYGSVVYHDISDAPYGTTLPDSLLPVGGSMKAWPDRIGGATVLMVEVTFTASGPGAATYTQWHTLVHDDSSWVWPQ